MNCRNGRLQGVGTETARSKSALGERDAFGDLGLDSIKSDPAGRAGSALPLQSFGRSGAIPAAAYERQQAHHLGFRKKVEEQSTQTDSLCRGGR